MASINSLFTKFAKVASNVTGRPVTFIIAVVLLIIWAISGPIFGFSDTWQLIINTGTTIITFLMVFLIQNTQNRDTEAMQIKIDELLHALKGTREELMDIEELDEKELDKLREGYIKLADKARKSAKGKSKD